MSAPAASARTSNTKSTDMAYAPESIYSPRLRDARSFWSYSCTSFFCYGLKNGLARHALELITGPVEVKMIDEIMPEKKSRHLRRPGWKRRRHSCPRPRSRLRSRLMRQRVMRSSRCRRHAPRLHRRSPRLPGKLRRVPIRSTRSASRSIRRPPAASGGKEPVVLLIYRAGRRQGRRCEGS